MISNDENQLTPNTMPGLEPSEPEKIKKIKKPWSKKKKGIVIGSIVGGLVLIGAAVAVWFLFFKSDPIIDIIEPEPEPVRFYSPLTGVETTEENTKLPVTAVIIENSPEARPQSGIAGNNVVFEAVAEGGITRFNVLFQEDRLSLIGPVRSLRSYYLEWATGFDSAQAHVGGSGDALSMIESGAYAFNIDEWTQGFPIWRTNDRYAPHNAYTDAENLLKFELQKGKTTSTFTSWERQDGSQVKPPQNEELAEDEDPIVDINTYANSINLPISTGIFAVSYEYNAETNSYDRYQGGVAHNDREKGQVSPDVVIAMMVNQYTKSDGLHTEVTTNGSGTAYIFQNGIVEKCIWRKSDAKTNIEFVNEEGMNIKLNRGQTWITAIGNARTPTWQ
ncbi:DUF3048 domain-containing protein [Ruminococcaceae bacterium OttesenSCG-928-A11]|nr:DUF3048 domain-containing protein [Ruminococcaceae bacterium OttesenSCG-928-A11]